MSKYFYGNSQRAVEAGKTQMIEHAKEIRQLIEKRGHDIELVAVNKYYRGHCICRLEGRLHSYTIYEDLVRRDYEFSGVGGDAWERAPNLVQIKDLELGQVEMF